MYTEVKSMVYTKISQERSTFYTESTLLFKPKDRVAIEDENKIVYVLDLPRTAIAIRMKLWNPIGK